MKRLVLVALILLSGTAHAKVPRPAPLDEMVRNRFIEAVDDLGPRALRLLPTIEYRAKEIRAEWVESYEGWKDRQNRIEVPVTAASASYMPQGTVAEIICDVFGPYCSQALSVVACESGFNTAAVNGQYLGLFQMGETERATYGHGADARTQAEAAFAYFIAAGSDWSPWACKP